MKQEVKSQKHRMRCFLKNDWFSRDKYQKVYLEYNIDGWDVFLDNNWTYKIGQVPNDYSYHCWTEYEFINYVKENKNSLQFISTVSPGQKKDVSIVKDQEFKHLVRLHAIVDKEFSRNDILTLIKENKKLKEELENTDNIFHKVRNSADKLQDDYYKLRQEHHSLKNKYNIVYKNLCNANDKISDLKDTNFKLTRDLNTFASDNWNYKKDVIEALQQNISHLNEKCEKYYEENCRLIKLQSELETKNLNLIDLSKKYQDEENKLLKDIGNLYNRNRNFKNNMAMFE